MAKPIKRYAEPPPREPRDHVEFERFIRDLDSGEIPPCQPREPNSNGTEYRLHRFWLRGRKSLSYPLH